MFEKLVDIICNYVEVEPENIHPESRFMEDLGFTSFDFMSMLGEIEDEFDVEVQQEEAANIRTVQEAVSYLEKLVSENCIRLCKNTIFDASVGIFFGKCATCSAG